MPPPSEILNQPTATLRNLISRLEMATNDVAKALTEAKNAPTDVLKTAFTTVAEEHQRRVEDYKAKILTASQTL